MAKVEWTMDSGHAQSSPLGGEVAGQLANSQFDESEVIWPTSGVTHLSLDLLIITCYERVTSLSVGTSFSLLGTLVMSFIGIRFCCVGKLVYCTACSGLC